MRAVVCKAFGPPEDLVVESVDDPTVGPDQLLVDVAAAAVVYPDTLMLEDKYQYKAAPPYIPGGEVAGVVVGVGEHVAGWSIGDRVLGALGATGGYAELSVVPAASPRRLPDSVDFAAAAGLNYAYGTTLYGLQHRAGLREGETLLVLGAGGSVGLSAVEIGKLMGARVIAAASTDTKLDVCRRARCRRHDQLLHRGSQGSSQAADGRQGRRRRLRLRRRCQRRTSAPRDRMGREVPRGRVHRRDTFHPAQPRPVEELSDRRRLLWRHDGS